MVNEHGEATGKLLSLQIKCGPSYLSESTKTGYIFRGDAEHLAYWLDHSLPVLLVLVDPSCRKCYWVEITAGAVERTGKGWKIEVPCHNVLGRDQRIQLAWIAQRDNLGSLVQAKIVRWLYLRFFGRISCVTAAASRSDPQSYHNSCKPVAQGYDATSCTAVCPAERHESFWLQQWPFESITLQHGSISKYFALTKAL